VGIAFENCARRSGFSLQQELLIYFTRQSCCIITTVTVSRQYLLQLPAIYTQVTITAFSANSAHYVEHAEKTKSGLNFSQLFKTFIKQRDSLLQQHIKNEFKIFQSNLVLAYPPSTW
jgi:hypothetical protein